MKPWLKITIWTLFFALIVILLAVTNREQKSIVLKSPKIHIDIQDENAFLTEKELFIRLKRKGLILNSQKNQQLQLNRIEKFVNGMTEVLDCNVYTKLGGDWAINVKIRRPMIKMVFLELSNLKCSIAFAFFPSIKTISFRTGFPVNTIFSFGKNLSKLG